MAELVEGPEHTVKVNLGYTKSMGAGTYEFVRVDIGLDVKGHGNPSETFNKAYDWAESRLIEKVDEMVKELKKVNGK